MSDIYNLPASRKYRLHPETVLRLNSIEVRDASRYYTTCPQCSDKRKTFHQNLKCLGVTRPDDERVYWGCNHCGWTGPGRNANGQHVPYHPKQIKSLVRNHFAPSTRTLYNYTPSLRKVKVVNEHGRRFWWEYKDRRGWWNKGCGPYDTEPMLYRIVTARKIAQFYQLPICIVEGEKDVDALMHWAIPATCNAHGASQSGKKPKWLKVHSEQLVNWDIAIFNDNDDAGYAHANEVFRLSSDSAKSIRILDHAMHFEGTKDISDWIKAGGSKADLLDFIAGAPEC